MNVQRFVERCAELRVVAILVFYVTVLGFYGWAVPTLASNLPDDWPLGGPDEAMHRSVSGYIARHLAWPTWDSRDLQRYWTGASYATASSFGYWVEGLSERFTGRARLGSLALFALLLTVLAIRCFRDRVTGSIGLTMLTPQVAFVFAYVNSDAWTVIVSFLLGTAAARFRHDPRRASAIVFLFAMLGASLTVRFHLWPLAALVGAYVLTPRLRLLWRERRRALLWGLIVALPLACWWPITSYRANDGDPIGVAAGRRAQRKFRVPDAPRLNVPWKALELRGFALLTAQSFYGVWGWMQMWLAEPFYWAVAVLGGVLALLLARLEARFVPLIAVLFLVNAALVVLYATTYDFQPQGRYLFPSFFLSMGLVIEDLALGAGANRAPRLRVAAGVLSAALVLLNIASIVWLGQYWAVSIDLPTAPLLP